LLASIGDAWSSGSLCTASEHFASALVRDRAAALLRRLPREPGAPLVVVSTPAGELHELGAMLAATTAKMQGYDVLYLGPNLPAEDIVLAVRSAGAHLVAMSVLALDPPRAQRELEQLVAGLPPGVPVVIGGAGAGALAPLVPGVTALSDLTAFERYLNAQRRARA
jgi:methanogenic corrinoid protein MtbC1